MLMHYEVDMEPSSREVSRKQIELLLRTSMRYQRSERPFETKQSSFKSNQEYQPTSICGH
jgi:hypothetical protein